MGRRSSPVPQLQCVGGSGAGRGWEPSDVQCYNRGSDGLGIQWQCKADVEATVKFGTLEVNCEGYDYPEDDFVLVGSCALKYKLELTMEGRTKLGLPAKTTTDQNSSNYIDGGQVVGLVIIILIVLTVFTLHLSSPAAASWSPDPRPPRPPLLLSPSPSPGVWEPASPRNLTRDTGPGSRPPSATVRPPSPTT